jgi:hypothetical protein
MNGASLEPPDHLESRSVGVSSSWAEDQAWRFKMRPLVTDLAASKGKGSLSKDTLALQRLQTQNRPGGVDGAHGWPGDGYVAHCSSWALGLGVDARPQWKKDRASTTRRERAPGVRRPHPSRQTLIGRDRPGRWRARATDATPPGPSPSRPSSACEPSSRPSSQPSRRGNADGRPGALAAKDGVELHTDVAAVRGPGGDLEPSEPTP